MIRNPTHGDHSESLQCYGYGVDIKTSLGEQDLHSYQILGTHLKLALSIQAQPIFTTHRPSSPDDSGGEVEPLEEHGTTFSGRR